MIRIEIKREPDNRITAIRASGHAEYAEYGYDIVCAAVTAVITTAMAALEDLLQIKHRRILQDGDVGFILDDQVKLSPEASQRCKLVLDTCELGLRQIEYSYGNEFLELIDNKSAPSPERMF